MSSPNPAAQNAISNDAILNSIITTGDLSKLTSDQKVAHYRNFCERLGLDPLSQPFKLLRLNGREILYCDRTGAQQLNKLHGVSHEIRAREIVNGCYVVTAQASTPDGRHTESIGAVPIENLKGDNLCNAMMKAETKGKRRATLDLLGLGILDETETDHMPEGSTAPAPVAAPAAEKAAPAKATPQASAAPATPEKKTPVAKNPPKPTAKVTAPDPAQKRIALLEALNGAKDIEQLRKVYYDNQDDIVSDVQLKQLAEERKAALEGKPATPAQQPAAPAPQQEVSPKAFTTTYENIGEVESFISKATSVEQLHQLYDANKAMIERTKDFTLKFTNRRKEIAQAVLNSVPKQQDDTVAQRRPLEWFEKRVGKTVWAQSPNEPDEVSEPYVIETAEFPKFMAEDMQSNGYTFRDLTAEETKKQAA